MSHERRKFYELTPIQFVTIREIRVMDFCHAGVKDYFLDGGNAGDFRRGHLARLHDHTMDEGGVGLAGFADAGPWLNSELKSPILCRVGINVIGPSIGGVVPGIQQNWDLQTGKRTVIVNVNVPFSVFSNKLLVKL